MSITVNPADDDIESWDEYVERSPHATPFHQLGALRLLADQAGAQLHPLVGYKGEQPVGILPIFEVHRGPITLVVSPPKDTHVYYLGPALLNTHQLKQRKLERRNRQFIESSVAWIDEEISPELALIRTVDRYTDQRPFKRSGYDVSPYYTYVVDLTQGWDELVMQFSSDARSNIRNTAEDRYEIAVGEFEDAREIISQVKRRHDEQGKAYHVTDEYVARLYSELPDGQVKPYVCRADDGIAGGILTLEFNDTIYRWQGGAKNDVDIPVNDLLDGYIIRDAMERGLARYDLVGANNPRLCRYKSKFAPELRTYYGAKRESRSARVLSSVRQTLSIDV